MILPNGLRSIIFIGGIFAAITHTEAECDTRTMTASVGEELELTCNIISCADNGFQWFKVMETEDMALDNSMRTYTVSVTSVMEFGGQVFRCQCRGSSICFIVLVNPVISLPFSNSTIEAGTSVNVTCIAESYPPANSSDYYSIQHPIGETLHATTFIDGIGVIHPIESASCDDSGPYACHVQVENKVSSDRTGTLIVYESGTPCSERTPVPTSTTSTGTSLLILTSTVTPSSTALLIVTSTVTPSCTTAPISTPQPAVPSQTCRGCQGQLLGFGMILGALIVSIMS